MVGRYSYMIFLRDGSFRLVKADGVMKVDNEIAFMVGDDPVAMFNFDNISGWVIEAGEEASENGEEERE